MQAVAGQAIADHPYSIIVGVTHDLQQPDKQTLDIGHNRRALSPNALN
jgi:hypothetical protein